MPNIANPSALPARETKLKWVDVTKVYEFDNGWYVGYIHHPDDLATFGGYMSHCAGTHFIWACEERIWYFFAVFDEKGIPHTSVHAKQATWVDKRHPRDDAEPMPCSISVKQGAYYPTFKDTLDSFKKAGKKYEPGKYRPSSGLTSCYYDHGARAQRDVSSIEYQYGHILTNNGNRPKDVDEGVWEVYVKAHKAVADNYRKNVGAIQIEGRRFKFDGKWLILLSCTDRSQGYVQGATRKLCGEWLNSIGRKGK